MKTSALQVIFAEDWLAKLWCGGAVTATIAVLTVRLIPTFEILGFSVSSALLGFSILIAGVAAYFASLIVGCIFLPPIFRVRERINGAPFEVNDLVRVLKKPNRGKVGRIVNAGNSQYGAFIRFEGCDEPSEPFNIPWHSIVKLNKKNQKVEQVGDGDAEEAV